MVEQLADSRSLTSIKVQKQITKDKDSLKWLCKPTFTKQRLSAAQPKLFSVFLSKKLSHLSSKLELDSRLIFFYVGKVGASLSDEVKIDHLDLLHVA